MQQTTIRDITIEHDQHGKIGSVAINGVGLRDIVSSGFKSVAFQFDPFRPENANVVLPGEYEQLFHSLFNAVDELWRSGRGCLAAYLSSVLFESLTPLWLDLMHQGRHILAIQFWRKVLSMTRDWEERTGKHVHKGSPYAFIANTYLVIGDIDTGFSYIYNAIEDDIRLNDVCPQLNYPGEAPVYLTASLSSNPQNLMIPLVREIRSELESFLRVYRTEFRKTLSMTEIDTRFLQNATLETVKYYFVLIFWTVCEHRRKVNRDLMQNDFSKLRNANWLFGLCLVIDKLFDSHPRYRGRFIGSEIVNYAAGKGLMTREDLNDLKDRENIQDGEPDQVIPKLIALSLRHNGVPVGKEVQYLLVAWNLRNFAGHNIQTQDVIVDSFEELLKILLCDIFLVIQEY